MAEGKHLFFLIHGLFGNKGHMQTMHRELERQLPSDKCIVVSSESNQTLKTFEGIEVGSLRIFEELINIASKTHISRISIVGYSMGGLYARYLVGMLHECGFFEEVKPMNFVTFATPHLGTTLWKQTYWTRFLNGLARVILGPSGCEMMSRGPNGILDKMADKSSVYMTGLKSFPNLMLFCNAIGDRTVKFWTSFITDKHPFSKFHDLDTELKFFEVNNDKYGSFLLDLNETQFVKGFTPSAEEIRKRKVRFSNLFIALIPLFFIILLSISTFARIKALIITPFLRMRASNLKKNYKNLLHTSETITTTSRSGNVRLCCTDTDTKPDSNDNIDFGEGLHLVAEELPPSDEGEEEIKIKSQYAIKSKSKQPPCPFDNAKPNVIDQTTRAVPMTKAIAQRMHNLNELPWKKYTAYLEHYRTHAYIIDRMKEGESQGTELIKFFSQQVLI